MLIRYETTIKDQIAVYQLQLKSSFDSRQHRRTRLALAGLGLLGALLPGIGTELWFTGLPLLVPLFFTLFGVRLITKGMSPLTVRTMLKGDNARGVLGLHELEITPDGFIDRTEYKETKYAWAMLDHIETEGDHTFILFGKLNIIAIPRDAVTEGSLPAFLKALGEHYTPAASLQTLALSKYE